MIRTMLFKIPEVERLLKHTLHEAMTHSSAPFDDGPAEPGLYLAGDDGVYLMSNGRPGLTGQDGCKNVVCYAMGMDPSKDPDWFERKRETYGGDDGVDLLSARPIQEMINHTRSQGHVPTFFVVQITDHENGEESISGAVRFEPRAA